jgi:hypothetical protein
MKIVKEHINEIFSKSEDKLTSLGVGKKSQIKEWMTNLSRMCLNDTIIPPRYEINKDLTIDVDSHLYLPGNFGNLPSFIQFNIVAGDFNCVNCDMTTLRGCPKKVGGYYDCSFNKLKNLDYAPTHVSSHFSCGDNCLLDKDEVDEYKRKILYNNEIS